MERGIDYGLGRTNIDHATGIRYGVISEHSVTPEAFSDIRDNGENLSHAAAVADAKQRIAAALTPVLEEMGVLSYVSKYSPRSEDKAKQDADVDAAVDAVWETIEQDWNDQYQEDEDTYRYEQDGYALETSSLGLYVIRSPYYTHAAFCSPCCPGAGDLDLPHADGERTYCLGPEWFEDGKAPYPVYRVDGKE